MQCKTPSQIERFTGTGHGDLFRTATDCSFSSRIKHIEAANEAHAIDTLLIADSLFRSNVLSERKRYVKIVEDVKALHGQVKIFSTMHMSGERK
jgi:eRF1 domain 3